jgi:hypothetical protein
MGFGESLETGAPSGGVLKMRFAGNLDHDRDGHATVRFAGDLEYDWDGHARLTD